MSRVFLIVMDSVGIGGAPDASDYYNQGTPDTGANTLLHIAQSCSHGDADIGRSGPLAIPTLEKMGLGAAVRLASGVAVPNMLCDIDGPWGVATETSKGKDTPSGHWEIAGLPVTWDWHYFQDKQNSFPDSIVQKVKEISTTDGILGNCHASGTDIIAKLGKEHCETGWPICYTSVDSVFQIAAHEDHFGLENLYTLCRELAPMLHDMKVGRVIARPFIGDADHGFIRTKNRKDFALTPPKEILTQWVSDAGHPVIAIGKIGDIFSMQGIDQVHTGTDLDLGNKLLSQISTAPDNALIFANFVEFDSLYGHRRDVAGYARALEWFDGLIAQAQSRMRPDDLMIITADHGNDPTWIGTDHTRERVPVLCYGVQGSSFGHVGFSDIATTVATYLGVTPKAEGKSFL